MSTPSEVALVAAAGGVLRARRKESSRTADHPRIDDLPLDGPRAEAVRVRLENMPETHRHTYRRAVSGRSKGAALKAMCAECTGYDRAAVKDCQSLGCPLWAARPWR